MIDDFNELAKLECEIGKPPYRDRLVNLVIDPPETFREEQPVIDYNRPVFNALIAGGRAQAEKAYQKAFCRQSRT